MRQLLPDSDNFTRILEIILSTLSVNEVLTTVVEEIRSLIGAERCTLYLINFETNELYSKVLQAENLEEIRIPRTYNNLAGYSAITGKALNIKDAYDESELKTIDSKLRFDRKWDELSGHLAKSVLVMPVRIKNDIAGVFQALNKPGGFSTTDMLLMEQLAFLLGIAVNNALLSQSLEEETKLREYIIDNIETGICILDSSKRVISSNKFLEVMSGMRYSTAEMAGKYFFELFPNLLNTQLGEKIDEALMHGLKKIALLEVLQIKIIPYFDRKSKVKKLILIFMRI